MRLKASGSSDLNQHRLALKFADCTAQLAGESYEAYCDTLLGSASVTANALNITSASNSAADTIFKLAQDLSAPGVHISAVDITLVVQSEHTHAGLLPDLSSKREDTLKSTHLSSTCTDSY